jgi:hypothetical protein
MNTRIENNKMKILPDVVKNTNEDITKEIENEQEKERQEIIGR